MRFARIRGLADGTSVALIPLAEEKYDDWVVAHRDARGAEVRRSSPMNYHHASQRYEGVIDVAIPDAAGLRAMVLGLVRAERLRQEEAGDRQRHDDVERSLTDRAQGCTPERMAEEYGIPSEDRTRLSDDMEVCDRAKRTWSSLAVEEMAAAVGAATDAQQGAGPEARVDLELVQLAAVVTAWLEDRTLRHLEKRHALALFNDAVAELARSLGDPDERTYEQVETKFAWWRAPGYLGPRRDGLVFSLGPQGPEFLAASQGTAERWSLTGASLSGALLMARAWLETQGVTLPTKGP